MQLESTHTKNHFLGVENREKISHWFGLRQSTHTFACLHFFVFFSKPSTIIWKLKTNQIENIRMFFIWTRWNRKNHKQRMFSQSRGGKSSQTSHKGEKISPKFKILKFLNFWTFGYCEKINLMKLTNKERSEFQR